MKKHTKTYLLLGFVLLVWGVIAFKLLSAFSPDSEPRAVVEDIPFEPQKLALKDTFSILAAYRDPFLGILRRSLKKKQSPQTKKPITVAFPSIVYTGLIGDQHNAVFFVSIAGNAYLMKKGDENDGVTLVRGTDTDLSIRYKGALKTIPLHHATP